MLLGEFLHTLDSKGRIFLPSKWREELAGEVIVTKGHESCLYVMTKEQFERRRAQLERLSSNRKIHRDHNRIFFSSGSEEPVDKSGRMSIPAGLRQYASLEKEVVLLGVSDRVEIWDRSVWADYQQSIDSYEALAEQID